MQFNNIFYGLAMMVLLIVGPLAAQAGATFSSTYAASAGAADVSITNNGAAAIYDISLQPTGPASDSASAPIDVGTLAAGGSSSVKISLATDMDYMVFSGSGTDVNGQPVEFSIVSEGR